MKKHLSLLIFTFILLHCSGQTNTAIKGANKEASPSFWSKEGFAAIASVIATLVSIGVAIYTTTQKKKTDKNLALLNAELSKQKSDYDSILKERQTVHDARLEYEYEARKRLYKEWEPLVFQLAENSANAYSRIQSLARTTRDGQLTNYNYLGHFGYYFISTIYKLFAPLAIFRLMQQKLTFVDLNLDKKIRVQYLIIKQVYLTWTHDFKIAHEAGLAYNPNVENWKELRSQQQDIYWRQGLPMGILDIIVSLLLDEKKERLLTYGEFETSITENPYSSKQVDLIKDVLTDFHPEKRPVLWRILVTQSILYTMFLTLPDSKDEVPSKEDLCSFEVTPLQLSKLSLAHSDSNYSEKLLKIVDVSKNYICESLKF